MLGYRKRAGTAPAGSIPKAKKNIVCVELFPANLKVQRISNWDPNKTKKAFSENMNK